MKTTSIFACFLLIISCGTASNVSKNSKVTENAPTVFEDDYYQNFEKNIVRLHHLMQGTFIAHSEDTDEKMKSWNVTGGDSVVLYSVALGEIAKHGFWIYSYEFMTSLPNEPIYTTVKHIKELSRDSFQILHYKTSAKLTLKEVMDPAILNAKVQIDKLEKTEKQTIFVRETNVKFVGKSVLYEDEQCNCLRQNTYSINPNYYNVETNYYDKESKAKIKKEQRPNFLVRRDLNKKLLDKIAIKE